MEAKEETGLVRADSMTWRIAIIRLGPALACMAAIFALSSRSTLPKPASISSEVFSIAGHLGAYFVLAICLWWALGFVRVEPTTRLWLAFAGSVLYGISDEWHQSFVPGRVPDWRDVLTDAIGAAIALLLVARFARRHGFDTQ